MERNLIGHSPNTELDRFRSAHQKFSFEVCTLSLVFMTRARSLQKSHAPLERFINITTAASIFTLLEELVSDAKHMSSDVGEKSMSSYPDVTIVFFIRA